MRWSLFIAAAWLFGAALLLGAPGQEDQYRSPDGMTVLTVRTTPGDNSSNEQRRTFTLTIDGKPKLSRSIRGESGGAEGVAWSDDGSFVVITHMGQGVRGMAIYAIDHLPKSPTFRAYQLGTLSISKMRELRPDDPFGPEYRSSLGKLAIHERRISAMLEIAADQWSYAYPISFTLGRSEPRVTGEPRISVLENGEWRQIPEKAEQQYTSPDGKSVLRVVTVPPFEWAERQRRTISLEVESKLKWSDTVAGEWVGPADVAWAADSSFVVVADTVHGAGENAVWVVDHPRHPRVIHYHYSLEPIEEGLLRKLKLTEREAETYKSWINRVSVDGHTVSAILWLSTRRSIFKCPVGFTVGVSKLHSAGPPEISTFEEATRD